MEQQGFEPVKKRTRRLKQYISQLAAERRQLFEEARRRCEWNRRMADAWQEVDDCESSDGLAHDGPSNFSESSAVRPSASLPSPSNDFVFFSGRPPLDLSPSRPGPRREVQ